jgi:cysteine desulfuration protein SufE
MANKTIDQIQEEIIEEFTFFEDDWMEKYEYIIDLGKKLPLIKSELKDEKHLIRGCQSQVWLEAEAKEGQIEFTADSDAVITKGLIALLVRTLSGQQAAAIAHTELYFIDRIGLQEHLSPTRSNGLRSMIKQMKLYGLAFAAKG